MKETGYILRTIDYKDNSKLLYAYTTQGIQSMLARGVKKLNSPMRHLTQTSTLIEMELSKGKLPTLTEATLLDYFPDIKKDIMRASVLSTVNEIIYYNVTHEDDHTKLFNFLMKFTDVLKTTEYPLELLMVFEMKFLFFAGYAVPLRQCHVCGKKVDLIFDIHEGATVCGDHKNSNHHHYDKEIFHPLTYYYYVDIKEFKGWALDYKTIKRCYEAITHLQIMHMGFTSKAKKILISLFD